jgi:hypothetical protein
MIAFFPGAARVDEALRVVRALGTHRYVAGRLHLIHAFAIAAIAGESTRPAEPRDAEGAPCTGPAPLLADARAWASSVLGDRRIDPGSRDELLWRRCTDAELLAVLDAFWTAGDRARATRRALAALLERHGLSLPLHAPFDETAEGDMHPVLVDAGWELLPLSALDADRHAGCMGAFGDPLAFEVARFEEQTAMDPPAYLVELPAIGPLELLRGATEDGTLVDGLVVWAEGHETYLDYVMRGVRRAAKI